MAKQKKKRRRSGQHRRPDDCTVHISLNSFRNAEETAEAFHALEEIAYMQGRDDAEVGRGTQSLSDFSEGYEAEPDKGMPLPMLAMIVKAHYAVYLDGYHGRAFNSRTVLEGV